MELVLCNKIHVCCTYVTSNLLLSFSEEERQAIWMSKMMMSLTPLFVMVLREATYSFVIWTLYTLRIVYNITLYLVFAFCFFFSDPLIVTVL